MDSRDSTLKHGEVRSFNTQMILIDLFQKGLAERKLSGVSNQAAVTILQKKIDLVVEGIQQTIESNPQSQIEAVKTLLIAAKESPQRNALVLRVSQLDPSLISLNAEGEKLNDESKHLIEQFWGLVVKSTQNQSPISKQDLQAILQKREALETHQTTFTQKMDKTQETAEGIRKDVEQMTGQSIEAPPPPIHTALPPVPGE